MAQQIKNPSAVQEPQGTWFNPWVRKVPFLVQGAQAAPAEADPRHHPALAQELGPKAGGQGHSYRRRLQVTGFNKGERRRDPLGPW